MSVEILAPVGGREQLIAAVRSGADAVYLGTKNFNARRNAENFEGASLKEAVSYCHARGVKVHVTVNTLVKDCELQAVYDEIEMLSECGADAAIVQDLAAAELFRRHLPQMPLHASTQMTIHNLEGVLAAAELGFSRVVLARELTLKEIAKICAESPIEIETFIHGALCMSVSGQCYLSSMLGERSGNRGLCAQPCRLNFRSGGREYALSLKDMSHIRHIRALAEAGVRSLKIEGRMKRPEYVAAAVTACRAAVRGEMPDLTKLRAVFSRSGFTDGYLTGKRDLEMFGYRTREDLKESGMVLGELAGLYRNELQRVPVSMTLTVRENENARLTVTDGTNTVGVAGDIPETARTAGTDEAFAYKNLSKTGGTPYVLNALTADIDGRLIMPSSKLNAMRKDALDRLTVQRGRIIAKSVTGTFVPPPASGKVRIPTLRVRLDSLKQAFDGIEQADRITLPLWETGAEAIARFGDKLICEMPRLIFPLRESAVEKRLSELKKLGLESVSAGNIGSVRLARRLGFSVHGGFDLNILNTMSLVRYESLGLIDTLLSFEINLADAAALGGALPRGIIGYGCLPLMLFRNCPAKGETGCARTGSCRIEDRAGEVFYLTCAERAYSTLHNPVPLYLGDKPVRGADFVTLYFTLEDAQTCADVWDRYIKGKPFDGKLTRGLYNRRLL